MAFWRRRERAPDPAPAHQQPPALPAIRAERALFALAVHARQIEGRLDRLEGRIDYLVDANLGYVPHDDLLDVRMHSAKLAGEIARLNVELRSEIEQAFEKAKAVGAPTAHTSRVAQLAESIIDLSDRLYDAAPAPEAIDQAV